jgi:hypothetical protein
VLGRHPAHGCGLRAWQPVDGARGGPFASRPTLEAAWPASVRHATAAARLAQAGQCGAQRVRGPRGGAAGGGSLVDGTWQGSRCKHHCSAAKVPTREKEAGLTEEVVRRWGGGDAVEGGSEEVRQRVDGHEEGDLAPTGGGPLGRRGNGRQRPGRGARERRTCPHSGERRRVADERGPAGSGRARGREARDTHGPAGEGNGVDRARMNSDDFQLFKPISNELEWF